ncbi:MAG: CapA family protein [bacterium]|nr:CapA family protein [bacterium]
MAINLQEKFLKIILYFIILFLIFSVLFCYFSRSESSEEISASVYVSEKPLHELLFLGDMMFDRGVEYQIAKNQNDFSYPFKKIKNLLTEEKIIVANLEGPINCAPAQFSDKSLKFSFDCRIAEKLSVFDLLSLANNHTFNTGENGLKETKKILASKGIKYIGHPFYLENCFLDYENLVFFAVNQTYPFNPLPEQVVEKLKEVSDDKFLIVLVHWGEEYQSESNNSQKNLARLLVDNGADLIIGGHSHTIQEVEKYKNKLIFYSLGNFIFDQYFSIETQENLGVSLKIFENKLIFSLIPIDSELSQPFVLEGKEKEQFLKELSEKSGEDLRKDLEKGTIILKH